MTKTVEILSPDIIGISMLPSITLLDIIELGKVNKNFNRIIRDIIKITPYEILRLKQILLAWNEIPKKKKYRRNSWYSKRYHPDNKIILNFY